MTRFCSKNIYKQTGTKATEIRSHHCLHIVYCDTTFPQFDDLIKHSWENHPYHCYYCKTTFVLFEEVIKHSTENHGSLMYFSINIRWHSQNVSSDSRKWLIKHLFPPSSCKKQINKHNSYLLTIRFRSGIRYARVQTFFAESVCTQWALMLTYSPLFVYKQERIIRFNQNGIIFELLTANPYMNQRTHPTCIYNV
jgi:hypothetical protein